MKFAAAQRCAGTAVTHLIFAFFSKSGVLLNQLNRPEHTLIQQLVEFGQRFPSLFRNSIWIKASSLRFAVIGAICGDYKRKAVIWTRVIHQ
jgi:hypothetical protein